MDLIEKVREQLKGKPIILTEHAQEQALFRDIEIFEIIENIKNPKRLAFVKEQQANNPTEQKYDCYFKYSKTQAHRYIIVINTRNIVCTVIKIKRRWQHILEKKR